MRLVQRIFVLGVIAFLSPSRPAASQEAVDPKVTELMAQLRSGEWTQRTMAAAMLGQMGKAAVPAIPLLVEPLRDTAGTPRIYRSTVPIALGTIGPPAKAAIPVLIEVLKTEDPEPAHEEANLWESARGNAAYALGTIGPADRAAVVPALLEAAKSLRGRIRANALASLAVMGQTEDEAEAIRVLIQVLEDWKDLAEGQQSAAEMLGRLGPRAKAAVPALTRALDSRSDDLRSAARTALGKISGPGAPEVTPRK